MVTFPLAVVVIYMSGKKLPECAEFCCMIDSLPFERPLVALPYTWLGYVDEVVAPVYLLESVIVVRSYD